MRPPEVDIYRSLPLETLEALDRYLMHAIDPGHALRAVLLDSLRETFARGDEQFMAHLPVLVRYLFNRVPMLAWGSRGNVEAWSLLSDESRGWAVRHSTHPEYIAQRREQNRAFVESCRENDPGQNE